jgi:signal recognition particle subunit SRP54
MFDGLTNQLQNVFSGLRKTRLTESNISDAVREVRLALLNADVNYTVTKTFMQRVKEKVLGEEVVKSVTPGQQFIKVIHDELVSLMGGEEVELKLEGKPAIIMMCGLQGSGKTTQCIKLANLLKQGGKKPLVVACDLQRPAAVEQLKVLGEQGDIPVFSYEGTKNPVKVAKKALKAVKDTKNDVLIIDTAGRLHIDKEMMEQLKKLRSTLKPGNILFVANAATGQDAVTTAAEFDKQVDITGTILTMLDGNTRGGAAISISEITKKPLLFEGIGERIDDFQVFNPQSMADRILGMGDTINLVRRAQDIVTEEDTEKLEQKMRKASFNYNDFIKHMGMLKKMGPMKGLLKMLPGVSQMPIDFDEAEEKFGKIEAIILSMTKGERTGNVELIRSRKKRIAQGSGTQIDEVNKLVKMFKQMKQMMKNMPKMKNLEKLFGGLNGFKN